MTRERRARWYSPTGEPVGEGERGATLIWVASMMIVLLGMASFAVDLGWAYLNQTRLQRAADAAALAGVVHLPAFVANATADAQAAAGANGFPIGGNTTMTVTQLADNKLEVTLTTVVPTFFLRVLGMDSFTLVRKSTAEYVKPVPLGSDSNVFGNGNDPTSSSGQESRRPTPANTRAIPSPHSASTTRLRRSARRRTPTIARVGTTTRSKWAAACRT